MVAADVRRVRTSGIESPKVPFLRLPGPLRDGGAVRAGHSLQLARGCNVELPCCFVAATGWQGLHLIQLPVQRPLPLSPSTFRRLADPTLQRLSPPCARRRLLPPCSATSPFGGDATYFDGARNYPLSQSLGFGTPANSATGKL